MSKPITKKQAVKIIKEFILKELVHKKWYENIKPHIKAIVLYGSTAKGINRLDSDIDFLIFVPLKIEKKFTKGEYFYDFNGREINVVLRSIERLRKLAKSQNDLFQAEVFRECEFIFEKDKEVRELIKEIKK